jgi:hypothetical protein
MAEYGLESLDAKVSPDVRYHHVRRRILCLLISRLPVRLRGTSSLLRTVATIGMTPTQQRSFSFDRFSSWQELP